MAFLVRRILEQALKTNENLYFVVLTGCMRISRKSIFFGLNHFRVYTISEHLYAEDFSFIDQEVKRLLSDYGMEDLISGGAIEIEITQEMVIAILQSFVGARRAE